VLAGSWQRLFNIPTLVVSPLAFLGGTFYSVDTLPPFWQRVTLLDPVIYFIDGFRWSFYGVSDVTLLTSAVVTTTLLSVLAAVALVVVRTGYRLKS
jgi:ABC-2 type transport system permease protein